MGHLLLFIKQACIKSTEYGLCNDMFVQVCSF